LIDPPVLNEESYMSRFVTAAALALLSGVASAHAPSFFRGPPPPPIHLEPAPPVQVAMPLPIHFEPATPVKSKPATPARMQPAPPAHTQPTTPVHFVPAPAVQPKPVTPVKLQPPAPVHFQPAPPVKLQPAPPAYFGPPAQHVPTAQAPEIDPASALAAMTLLAGGIFLMRGRKAG
jgi:hypothetical protein